MMVRMEIIWRVIACITIYSPHATTHQLHRRSPLVDRSHRSNSARVPSRRVAVVYDQLSKSCADLQMSLISIARDQETSKHPRLVQHTTQYSTSLSRSSFQRRWDLKNRVACKQAHIPIGCGWRIKLGRSLIA